MSARDVGSLRGWGLACVLALGVGAAQAAERTAEVDWGPRWRLATPLTATVAEAPCRPGQRVQAGTLLYRLEAAPLTAAVAEAEARLRHAELLWAEARREMDRAEELYADALIADHERDRTAIDLAAAEARRAAARAALATARQRLAWSRLGAPVTGRVLACHRRLGEVVNGRMQAVPMAEMVAEGTYLARFALAGVARKEMPALGQEVAVVLADGRRLSGRVWHLQRDPDEEARRWWVAVRFESETALTPGTKVTVRW